MNIEEILKEILAIIERHTPKDTPVILFGSWAKGTAKKTSDLDIGILPKETLPGEAMTQIIRQVDALPTLRKIDIVDLSSVEERFKNDALKNHKLLTPTQ